MAEGNLLKPQLVFLLERARQYELALAASLTEREKEAAGEPEHWAAKDELAHEANGKERQARYILGVKNGTEPPPSVEEFNQTNAQVFEQFRHCTFAEVLELCEKAHAACLECVQALSEEDLKLAEILPWQNGRPLWRLIVGIDFMHPIQHLAQIYTGRGDVQAALAVQTEAAELMSGLDDSPEWKGTLIYNLACQYSLSDMLEKAISSLQEAYALNPRLVEWSKQDTDLDPIRDTPEFQALYPA